MSQATREGVLEVIRSMGFKEQLGATGTSPARVRPELAIVQDAGAVASSSVHLSLRPAWMIGVILPSRACTQIGWMRSAPSGSLARSSSPVPNVRWSSIGHQMSSPMKSHRTHQPLADLVPQQKGPGTPIYDPACPPRVALTKEEYVSNHNSSALKYVAPLWPLRGSGDCRILVP